MRGVLTLGVGGGLLRECGAPSGRALTVADPSGSLATAMAGLASDAARGVYAELNGELSSDGSSLAAPTLLRARDPKEPTGCDVPVFDGEYRASGNEPFWSVEIRQDGIIYSDPTVPTGRTYPYAFTRTETGSVVYATKITSPAVSTLEIALEPGRCVDSMFGEIRGFAAHAKLDGRKLEGCAAPGVPHGEFGSAVLDELSRYAGCYPSRARLWSEPTIHRRLEALLGAQLPDFLENMKVESPLTKDNDVYYTMGNKPHQGGSDGAIFLADAGSDTIEVILFVRGERKDVGEGGRDVAAPAEVTAALSNLGRH